MAQLQYDIPQTAPYAFQSPRQGAGVGGQAGAGLIGLAALAIQQAHEKAQEGREFKHNTEMNKMLHDFAMQQSQLTAKLQEQLAGSEFGRQQAAKYNTTPELWSKMVAPKAAEVAVQNFGLQAQKTSNELAANSPDINPGIAQANALGANATAQKPMTDQQVALRQTAPMGGISVQPNVNGGFDTAKGGSTSQSTVTRNPYMPGNPIVSQEQSTGIPGSFNPGQPPFKPEDVPPIDNTSAAPDAAPQTAPFQMNSGLFNPSAGVSNMLGGSTPPVGAIQSPSASSAMPDVAPAQPSISSMDVSGLGPVQEWLKQFLLRQAQSTMPQVQPR